MSAAYIQVYFRLDFIMGANNMNPNQTAECSVAQKLVINFSRECMQINSGLRLYQTGGLSQINHLQCVLSKLLHAL